MLSKGGSLIAIHRGRYFDKADGQLYLGPGPFVAALEFASGVQAQAVGKPEPEFFLAALKDIDPTFTPDQAVMIGDDAKDDIAGAKLAGLAGILVKTGKYRVGDESRFTPAPDLTANSVVEAIDAILSDVKAAQTSSF